MPIADYLSDVKVEIAWNAGYGTPSDSRVWTDVSAYVEAERGITITRGRADEASQVSPSTLTLTLDNRDGRFTAERAGSPYFPNVKIGRPIRVTATWLGVTYSRFLGYVDVWPVSWDDGTDQSSYVTITASSRQARFGLDVELASIVEEQILLDDPVVYFPLSEPAGSTSAGNVAARTPSAARAVLNGLGTAPTFGVAGLATDGELTSVQFAPNGQKLVSDNRAAGITGSGDFVLEAFMSGSVGVTLASALSGVIGLTRLAIDGAGNATVTVSYPAGGGSGIFLTSSGPPADDEMHHLAVWWIAATKAARLYVDGVLKFGSADLGMTMEPNPLLYIGGDPGFVPGSGRVGHVAVYDSFGGEPITEARIAARAAAGVGGYMGDLAGARVQRYAELAGVPAAEVSAQLGATPLGSIDSTGQTPLGLMQAVEESEGGLLFDGADGTLVFQGRAHRYAAVSAFSLSVATQEVGAGIEPKYDRQGLLNDVTVTSAGGVVGRAVDASSVSTYGVARASLSTVSVDPGEPYQAAAWRVNTYREPRTRIPALDVDLLHVDPADLPALLAAELGTRFTVFGLPTQAAAASADFFIEGYTETISHAAHTMAINASPAAISDVWLLDSGAKSQLDTTTRLAW